MSADQPLALRLAEATAINNRSLLQGNGHFRVLSKPIDRA